MHGKHHCEYSCAYPTSLEEHLDNQSVWVEENPPGAGMVQRFNKLGCLDPGMVQWTWDHDVVKIHNSIVLSSVDCSETQYNFSCLGRVLLWKTQIFISFILLFKFRPFPNSLNTEQNHSPKHRAWHRTFNAPANKQLDDGEHDVWIRVKMTVFETLALEIDDILGSTQNDWWRKMEKQHPKEPTVLYIHIHYIYIFYINPRYSYKRRPHFFIILISYRIPLPFSGQKLPPQNFPLMRGTNVDLPASMERLLVPTKSWAQRIGIRKTCLGFSLKKVDGTGIGWVF